MTDKQLEEMADKIMCGNRTYVISKLKQIQSETAKEKINGETSDGYHTFNELYDHRVLLWINLCLNNKSKCYLVEDHYEGWFLLGMETEAGQVSYHCPNKYLNLCDTIERKHPEFDGHTSKDVVDRLEKLAQKIKTRYGLEG